ncbi:cytochrome P450 [Pseudomaricurvus alkylphenolicus]|uniref:cytochrome P450 n=1 Tax=Pseudomaricurvus alkylphenolicus TaxID=1306991 RepID=UPI00141F3889|nr:cytochrome P450 [Pseudomaricurvus alkylphenolicus]NIB44074.1 cytochrome P450 [Pseudomaricurvus alkylphenolicus]
MTESTIEDMKLENAYSAVSATYKGTDIDIHEACREMRETTPVYEGDFIAQFGVPTNAGLALGTRPNFALFKYNDVMSVLRDGDTFTNGFIAKGFGEAFNGLTILAMDGDEHKSVRQLLHPAFMPASVNKWHDRIDEVIRRDYILPMVADKKADLMTFGLDFPLRIMYALMGFPEDDAEKYRKYAAWSLAMVGGNQIDPDKVDDAKTTAKQASKALYQAINEVVVSRRAAGSEGDDLIGRLLRAEHEGRMLNNHEVVTFAMMLLPAAGETTTRTLSSVLTIMFTTPGLLEKVRDNRELIPKLIDETVRYEPVATFKVREVAKDVEIRGVSIPKGSFVQCMVTSANRDEEAFENGETFDVDRKAKPSFGFGFGPHMCIGQFVAKLELKNALNAIFDLLPNIRLDPSKPAPVIEGAQLRGASSVHVIWD